MRRWKKNSKRDSPRDAIARARHFRGRMNAQETILWEELRASRIAGLKFRKKYPLGSYIVDFFCPDIMLAIEITKVAGKRRKPSERNDYFADEGYVVLRFSEKKIETSLPAVVAKIRKTVEELTRF